MNNWIEIRLPDSFKDHPIFYFSSIVIIALFILSYQILSKPNISIMQTSIISIIAIGIIVIALLTLILSQKEGIAKKRKDSEDGIKKVDETFGIRQKNR